LLCAIHKRSLVVYISASLWLSAHKTLVYNIRVSQGSVATPFGVVEFLTTVL